jgi:hypothetical protein
VGGNDPHSDRQRAKQVCPASVQLTNDGSLMTTPYVRLKTRGKSLGSLFFCASCHEWYSKQVLQSTVSPRVTDHLLDSPLVSQLIVLRGSCFLACESLHDIRAFLPRHTLLAIGHRLPRLSIGPGPPPFALLPYAIHNRHCSFLPSTSSLPSIGADLLARVHLSYCPRRRSVGMVPPSSLKNQEKNTDRLS